MIKFGAWSITLAIGSLHGLLMCSLLWRTRMNRLANHWLAALLAIVVLMITPYTIGYAGFYDAYPGLTFAPFYWQLGIGPLIWLYVRQIGSERPPIGWPWHFGPLLLQVGYYTILFCLPLEAKWRWNDAVHQPVVAPTERALTALSIASYLLAAIRQYQGYQRWLIDHSAAREELHLGWLRGFLVSMALATAAAIGFGMVHVFFRRLSYFDEFPLYVAYTALVWYLGVEGWRHAGSRYPRVDAPEPGVSRIGAEVPMDPTTRAVAAAPVPVPHAHTVEPFSSSDEHAGSAETRLRSVGKERDWANLGARVQRQVVAGQWWREPDLELAELARRIGTNTNYVSRALNEGLGMSFSEFVNRLRVEAAQQRLLGPGDVLEIAFDVGFRSKASFNRAFRAFAGTSPSAWRQSRRGESPGKAGAPRLES